MQASVFRAYRQLVLYSAKGLSPEQLFEIPEGRSNNIAWNLGHILTVQQRLVYGLSSLPMYIPDHYPAFFGKDTSPDDWSEPVDVPEILRLLSETADHFVRDVEADRFQTYSAFTTSTRVEIKDAADAAAFNHFHEGVHVGIILSIRRQVS